MYLILICSHVLTVVLTVAACNNVCNRRMKEMKQRATTFETLYNQCKYSRSIVQLKDEARA